MSNYLMLFIFFFASNNMCTAAKNTLSFGQRGFLEKKDKTSLLMKKVFQEGLCSVSLNNKCTDDSFGTSSVAFKKQFFSIPDNSY